MSAFAESDARLEDAWARRADAFSVYSSLPHCEKDGEPYTPEERAQLAIIDEAEEVVRSAVAQTPRGVAIQLWTQLAHTVTSREHEAAAHRRDLAYFEAQGDTLDWAERLTIAAIRSLVAMEA
jgi:hypothetical protein